MNAIKDLKLDDLLDDLRDRAMQRIDELVKEGRKQARHAGGGHETTSLFSAFTIGILAGAIVGAAVALLITPLSGKQAREKLSERVDKFRSSEWGSAGVGEAEPGRTFEPVGTVKAAGSYEPDYTAPKPLS